MHLTQKAIHNGHFIRALSFSFIFMSVLYCYFYSLGMTELTGGKAIRDFSTGLVLLTLTQVSSGYLLTHVLWRAVFPAVLFWLLPVPFVLVNCSITDAYFDRVNPCLLMVLGGIPLLFFLILFLAHLRKKPLSFLCGIGIGTFSLFPIIFFVYYLIYHKPFSASAMLPVLQTNCKEAAEYFLQTFSPIGIIILVSVASFIIFAYGYLLLRVTLTPGSPPLKGLKRRVPEILLLIASLLLFGRWITWCFPFQEYKQVRSYEKEVAESNRYWEENATQLVFSDTPSHELPKTVILVIGESANRDHLKAFTPTHFAETTPWFSGMREKPFLFSNTYANYPVTVGSLSMYLTSMNQYNGQTLQNAVTIVDVAKKAGYTVYWLSNQAKMGKFDNVNSIVAERADYKKWTSVPTGDEKQLLPLLENIPEADRKFIVLHLIGSHARYKDRLHEPLSLEFPSGISEKEQDYDRTLLYTDHFLEKVFDYGNKHWQLDAMIYCPDHGEDMVSFDHSVDAFTFSMVRIPLWIYLSDEYKKNHPETAAALAAHQDDVFTNDLMFDTVSGILQAPNNFYDARFDLSSTSYNLTWNEALTLHGQEKVTDDPMR